MKNPKDQANQIPDFGKVPPQAVDMEDAVLGALLLDRESIDVVFPILKPEYFYREGNGLVFDAILKLYSLGSPIDLMTVTERLRKDNNLETVGGAYYVTSLSIKVASSANVEYHSRIVADKYFLRKMISYSGELINKCFAEDEDTEDIIDFANISFDGITYDVYGKKKTTSFKHLIKQSIDEYGERERNYKEGRVSGIPTPVPKLTSFTQGWQKGDLVIIAGRPSMGKTAVVLSVLKTAAMVGESPAIFSLEMSGVRLVDRMLVGEAGISPERFRTGDIHPDEYQKLEEAAGRLYNLGIYIDDNSGVSMEYIKNRCRVLKRKGLLSLVVIDYLQLVDVSSQKGKNREQEVAEISKKAKLLAKELDVPVILLAQLNRGCELRGGEKRPVISDLRESGSIEQDADMIILLYRSEYYKILEDENGNSTKGKGEFIIGKQRNGKTGTIFFGYNEGLTEIFEYNDGQQWGGVPHPDSKIEPNTGFDSEVGF